MRLIIIGWACLGWLALEAAGQIAVEGVQDRQQYSPTVAFRILAEMGYTYQAALNGQTTPIATWVEVTVPGFYELAVSCQKISDGSLTQQTFRFALIDPVRGDAEWGLAPWTPRPLVNSSASELSRARLETILPARFPAGMDYPIIALTENDQGQAVRLNGIVEGQSRFQVKRGYGFGFATGSNESGTIACQVSLGALQATRNLEWVNSPAWIEVASAITNDTVWPSNSFMRVTTALTISTGATLTIKAGSVVMVGPGLEITVSGKLSIQGERANPVVFIPAARARPWGGFVCWGTPAEIEVTGAIFTGGGADNQWFTNHGIGSSHRKEEALFYLGSGVSAAFTNAYLIENSGQAFHGEEASLTMDHCLIQRCQTGGQFNGGAVTIHHSALMDFPTNDSAYVDGDNDAFYFSLGTHELVDDVIGWTKDDGLDAGADTAGQVTVSHCWFEACFHEGMALSGTGKRVRVYDSVFVNCGQGIEAGYLSPQVYVEHCLLAANGVGARFGDNYASEHTGWLEVTNSLSLFNRRDVWGMDRNLWAENTALMDIRGNWLSVSNQLFPENRVWQPEQDAETLAAFQPGGNAAVGVGFLEPFSKGLITDANPEITIGLSAFSTQAVKLECVVTGDSAVPGVDFIMTNNSVTFMPGEMRKTIPIQFLAGSEAWLSRSIQLVLSNAVNAEIIASQAAHARTLSGDADGDGLPDIWEQAIIDANPLDSIKTIVDVTAGADFDHDGLSNLEEYLAGTNPVDTASNLRIDIDSITQDSTTLILHTVAGRSYAIEYCDALSPAASWIHLAEIASASSAGTQQITDHRPTGPTARFYRVIARQSGD
jgi:hypothetical protein